MPCINHRSQVLVPLAVLLLIISPSHAAVCATDGSDYSYTETISGETRTITLNYCPNHPWYKINPNDAWGSSTTYKVPANPKFVGEATSSTTASANIDLSSQGGSVGVFFSGAQLYSPYGGPKYGTVTGYSNSATVAEGDTFDQCGGHASSSTSTSYHYHVPPHCLLKQLGQTFSSGTTSGAHSPQIGWAGDGFPLYGPHGPGGVVMKTCTVTGGTYGTDVCTDDCGGYYSADSSIDKYVYRYYIQGTYNDGTSCDEPGCPSPGEDYYPNTPVCYRGCCPSGVTCSTSAVKTCTTFADGYVSSFSASVPTINGLSLANGLPAYSAGCAYASLKTATCSSVGQASQASASGSQMFSPSSVQIFLVTALAILTLFFAH